MYYVMLAAAEMTVLSLASLKIFREIFAFKRRYTDHL